MACWFYAERSNMWASWPSWLTKKMSELKRKSGGSFYFLKHFACRFMCLTFFIHEGLAYVWCYAWHHFGRALQVVIEFGTCCTLNGIAHQLETNESASRVVSSLINEWVKWLVNFQIYPTHQGKKISFRNKNRMYGDLWKIPQKCGAQCKFYVTSA